MPPPGIRLHFLKFSNNLSFSRASHLSSANPRYFLLQFRSNVYSGTIRAVDDLPRSVS